MYPLYFKGFVKIKNDTNTETTTSKNVDENNETSYKQDPLLPFGISIRE